MIETKVGLPNTCCKCGQNPGATWFAPNVDAARSGHGFCRPCAFPEAKADSAPGSLKESEPPAPPPAAPPAGGPEHGTPSTPTPPAPPPGGKGEGTKPESKPKREQKPKAEKKP